MWILNYIHNSPNISLLNQFNLDVCSSGVSWWQSYFLSSGGFKLFHSRCVLTSWWSTNPVLPFLWTQTGPGVRLKAGLSVRRLPDPRYTQVCLSSSSLGTEPQEAPINVLRDKMEILRNVFKCSEGGGGGGSDKTEEGFKAGAGACCHERFFLERDFYFKF